MYPVIKLIHGTPYKILLTEDHAFLLFKDDLIAATRLHAHAPDWLIINKSYDEFNKYYSQKNIVNQVLEIIRDAWQYKTKAKPEIM